MNENESDETPLLQGLISCTELHRLLTDTHSSSSSSSSSSSAVQLHIFDTSWYLPAAKRDARAEFDTAHITGAQFFDVDLHADLELLPWPHMLPHADRFARDLHSYFHVGLPLDHEQVPVAQLPLLFVLYDASNLFMASTRLYYTMRAFGLSESQVKVLDGGLAEWKALFPKWIESSSSATPVMPRAISSASAVKPLQLQLDRAHFVADKARVLSELALPHDQRALFVDARSLNRFKGLEAEPREAKRAGHIPGAISLCHVDVQTWPSKNRQGFKSRGELLALLQERGFPNADAFNQTPQRDMICYCGSGLTACTIWFVVKALGYERVRIYDASCAEYLNCDDVPLEN